MNSRSSRRPPPRSSRSANALVGCLLDVSNSMRRVLEPGKGDKRAVSRLRAVLRAALKLAKAEQRQNPNAAMFLGAFGVRSGDSKEKKESLVVDLYGLVEALLVGNDVHSDIGRSGHELLISLANRNNVAHITKYIKERLKDDEARTVYMYLQRHPEEIAEFVNAIPPAEELEKGEKRVKIAKIASALAGTAVVAGTIMTGGLLVVVGSTLIGVSSIVGGALVSDAARDHAIEDSDALKLARRICKNWLLDFEELVPRPVGDVVFLLERLEDHPSFKQRTEEARRTILDELEPYLYGWTPMRSALEKSLTVFRRHAHVDRRVIVLISDGICTDGDPLPLASKLKEEKVTIANIFLTDDTTLPRRLLHDQAPQGRRGNGQRTPFREISKAIARNFVIDDTTLSHQLLRDEGSSWRRDGQGTLFKIASKTSVVKHPIPVLASVGWTVPSSGECGLYATVHSADALEEFCSILLSARFGSADALLDLVGRVELDAYIDDAQMRTRNNPSRQEGSTCYAHAAAAVLHMALVRIEGREGGYPSIEQIRSRILREFPPGLEGGDVLAVLRTATQWYRPLRIKQVDENGARQAVIRRRPVLATFDLSERGWTPFMNHFMQDATRRTILTRPHMAPYRMEPPKGSHAVVLVQCGPHSLTFLNSWGKQWGDNGSFSIEDPSVLEVDGASESTKMLFFDIFWYEEDLTDGEKQAFERKANERVRNLANRHRAALDFESECPRCKGIAPVSAFTGSIRKASCPLCYLSFKPEAEHLVKALYARDGISDPI